MTPTQPKEKGGYYGADGVDQVGLLEGAILEGPEQSLANQRRKRGPGLGEIAPVLEKHSALGVGPRVGADQDQAIGPFGVMERELLGDHPPHERSQHVGALDLERLQQAREILGEVGSGEGTTGVVAFPDTAVVIDQNRSMAGELGHLER